MSVSLASEGDSARTLRRLFVLLGALSIVATAIELAMQRHWDGPMQLIPWLTLAALSVALVLVVLPTGRARLWIARGVAVAAVASACFGMYEHVSENHSAGALDFRYADRWDSLSGRSQWWKAVTKTVGPAPVLAPAALAEASFCVFAATLVHPAFRRTR